MIKRLIAGALSAAICTSSAGSTATAGLIRAGSDRDDSTVIISTSVKADGEKADDDGGCSDSSYTHSSGSRRSTGPGRRLRARREQRRGRFN